METETYARTVPAFIWKVRRDSFGNWHVWCKAWLGIEKGYRLVYLTAFNTPGDAWAWVQTPHARAMALGEIGRRIWIGHHSM